MCPIFLPPPFSYFATGVPSKDRKVQKIEKKEQKKEQKLVRKSNAEEVLRFAFLLLPLLTISKVAAWLLDLGLPRQTAEKYLKLFEEEVLFLIFFLPPQPSLQEIFTLAQVKQLTSQHLHDWMGVKTGTVLLMLEAIQDLGAPLHHLQTSTHRSSSLQKSLNKKA